MSESIAVEIRRSAKKGEGPPPDVSVICLLISFALETDALQGGGGGTPTRPLLPIANLRGVLLMRLVPGVLHDADRTAVLGSGLSRIAGPHGMPGEVADELVGFFPCLASGLRQGPNPRFDDTRDAARRQATGCRR